MIDTSRRDQATRRLSPMQAVIMLCRAFLAQTAEPEPAVAGGQVAERHQSGQEIATDWEELSRLASFHRVAPLVWRAWQNRPSPAVPREIADRLGRESRDAATRNLFLTAELLRIDEAFTGRGIVFVPYKGPVLAKELYGDVALRVFGDLDLVLEPQAIPAALDALFELGYVVDSCRAEPPSRELLLKFAASRRGEIPLTHAEKKVPVDLHWNVLGRNRLQGYRFADSISPQKLPLANRSLLRFKGEDLFTFLSLHGFKHAWERLNWLVDLAMLLKSRGEGLNWKSIASRLDGQSAVATLTGVLLVEALLGVGGFGVEGVFRRPLVERARELADFLAQGLQEDRDATGSSEFATLFRLYWQANLTPLAKARWLGGHLGLVGFEELDRLRLPTPLFPLYYPARCLRLAAKCLLPS